MLIECARCEIRGRGCADCLITVLYDTPEAVAALGPAEQYAVDVFTRVGFDVEVLSTTEPTVASGSRPTPIPVPVSTPALPPATAAIPASSPPPAAAPTPTPGPASARRKRTRRRAA